MNRRLIFALASILILASCGQGARVTIRRPTPSPLLMGQPLIGIPGQGWGVHSPFIAQAALQSFSGDALCIQVVMLEQFCTEADPCRVRAVINGQDTLHRDMNFVRCGPPTEHYADGPGALSVEHPPCLEGHAMGDTWHRGGQVCLPTPTRDLREVELHITFPAGTYTMDFAWDMVL